MRITDWSSDVCSSDLPPVLIDSNVESCTSLRGWLARWIFWASNSRSAKDKSNKQRFPRGSNQYEGRSFCGFLPTFRRHIMTKQSQHIYRTPDHLASGSINTTPPRIPPKLITHKR